MEIVRADSFPLRCGAWYVRIEAMARKHGIPLEKEFDEHDGEDTWYVVALDATFPVGTARMYPLDDTRVMIGRVVVLPEYRHQGTGTQIVRACEAWAREMGYAFSHLEARENKLDFYRKLGYTPCGEALVSGDTFRCIPMEKALMEEERPCHFN